MKLDGSAPEERDVASILQAIHPSVSITGLGVLLAEPESGDFHKPLSQVLVGQTPSPGPREKRHHVKHGVILLCHRRSVLISAFFGPLSQQAATLNDDREGSIFRAARSQGHFLYLPRVHRIASGIASEVEPLRPIVTIWGANEDGGTRIT